MVIQLLSQVGMQSFLAQPQVVRVRSTTVNVPCLIDDKKAKRKMSAAPVKALCSCIRMKKTLVGGNEDYRNKQR
jgi:hypothetical protein